MRGARAKIMVIVVIFILFSSSLAFIAINTFSFTPGTDDGSTQQLTDQIVRGDVNAATEQAYLQSGYTFLKYYYTPQTQLSSIESLPETFRTNTGAYQLFVVEIPSDVERAVISGPSGIAEADNLTYTAIVDALCDAVISPPPECTLEGILNATR